MIGDNGGCFDAITSRVKELLPILCNKSIPMKCRGRVFSSGVRGVLLHASMTWAVTVDNCNKLIPNDNAMVRWVCSSRLVDKIPTAQMRDRLDIPSLEDCYRADCVCTAMYNAWTMPDGKRRCFRILSMENILGGQKRDGWTTSKST